MQTLEPPSATPSEPATRLLLETGKVKIDSHADDPRWQIAWRIATSGSLGRSRLLARFLLFTVDRLIRGRSDEITEQQIGILVFDRNEGYDSNEDNIVRSYARKLRRRIDNYYANEGKNEEMYLDIPRGGYVPSFTQRDLDGSARSHTPSEETHTEVPDMQASVPLDRLQSDEETGSAPRTSFALHQFLRRYGILLALCMGISIGLSLHFTRFPRLLKHGLSSSDEDASKSLWQQMFVADRDTFVVPSDDGLVIMQRLTERPVPLARYIDGSYRNSNSERDQSNAEILKLGARRYTSIVDLDFAVHLMQVDGVDPARLVVRYARDLRMDDLRTGNAVLIGSVESNPWIQIFEPQMNFRQRVSTNPQIPSGFLNTHPHPGERDLYGTPGRDHTYGQIAYVPNLSSVGHVLIVGGLNTAGTQAATTFLLTPSLMAPILRRAQTADGQIRPFELLVSADNFSSNASTPQLITERIENR
ncbi:hypothetical protein [Edaphobacter aggregans]|uniref:hypothetical protein n=1 Tax=Edaphobacter aggregans TaxID=570835 RepID=UPI000550C224|nr:hypothetical protein [Edaphobacter aggregans]